MHIFGFSNLAKAIFCKLCGPKGQLAVDQKVNRCWPKFQILKSDVSAFCSYFYSSQNPSGGSEMTLTVKKVLKITKSMQRSNWLNFLARYHGFRSAEGGWPEFPNFERVLIYISDFWGYFWSPEAINISTDSWDDVLHDTTTHVSRSGKFTAFYIPYVIYVAEKSPTDHTVRSHASRI